MNLKFLTPKNTCYAVIIILIFLIEKSGILSKSLVMPRDLRVAMKKVELNNQRPGDKDIYGVMQMAARLGPKSLPILIDYHKNPSVKVRRVGIFKAIAENFIGTFT
jgi:hypothetical protein